MIATDRIPALPENAPFTAEQRAYLNGFLAGLFSRASPQRSEAQQTSGPLTILFGSQTGNAEALAKRVAREASKRGFAPAIFEMAKYPPDNLPKEKNLLVITSTYGDGDPPDNAKAFWQFLASDATASLPNLNFSVLALGDSNYAKFCQCGKNFDQRLVDLGAQRIHPRFDCDVDFEAPFQQWLEKVLSCLFPNPSVGRGALTAPRKPDIAEEVTGYSRSNPFLASLITNRNLNASGSNKETRHLEISLEGSGLKYHVGDALGVVPVNCPNLVEEILHVLGCSGDESVRVNPGIPAALRDALLRHCEITRISQPLLKAFAEKTRDETLKRVAAPDANGEFSKFIWGRDILDLLLAYPNAKFEADDFVALLKKLQPRLYSISSSPKVHANQVHLTVGTVRYETHGRKRKGVCSCFLAERVRNGTPVPVFVQENKNFRPPADGSLPAIMVGPGTGIAPFRAFLQERYATGASGKNWLFFGDQHAATDFLYREELEAMHAEGKLTKLDTAFSRDQPEKIYVQHRMVEHARELFDWIEQGAHLYVCGDAKQMAKDVDAALHFVIEKGGGLNPGQAADYVKKLQADKRYQRDIY